MRPVRKIQTGQPWNKSGHDGEGRSGGRRRICHGFRSTTAGITESILSRDLEEGGNVADGKGVKPARNAAAENSFDPAFAALKRSLRQLLWMIGILLALVVAIAWRVYS